MNKDLNRQRQQGEKDENRCKHHESSIARNRRRTGPGYRQQLSCARCSGQDAEEGMVTLRTGLAAGRLELSPVGTSSGTAWTYLAGSWEQGEVTSRGMYLEVMQR